MASEYQLLDLPPTKLNLEFTLPSGQAFRWKQDHDGFWSAPVQGQVIRIREAPEGFVWQTYPQGGNLDLIRSYFRLDEDVEEAYRAISEADPDVALLVKRYRGLRFLRQDPEECLLSFVCSAANSIPRIMVAVDELSRKYGDFITEVAGREFYSFPSAAVLAEADPDDLASTASLGFRGANLHRVASQVAAKDHGWLMSLRERSYKEAKAELITLSGVGQKIADCVCLFALDKDEAVPVDTHIRQIAARMYLPDLTAKSVTENVYQRVTQAFQERFGRYAGWAQQFLYFDDIRHGRRETATRRRRESETTNFTDFI